HKRDFALRARSSTNRGRRGPIADRRTNESLLDENVHTAPSAAVALARACALGAISDPAALSQNRLDRRRSSIVSACIDAGALRIVSYNIRCFINRTRSDRRRIPWTAR